MKMMVLTHGGFLPFSAAEGFSDWGGRGYDDFVPGEVTKTAHSGDESP